MLVKPCGPTNAKMVVVGEAPGEMEDRFGIPFHPNAPAGSTLERLLRQTGLSRQSLRITNVSPQRPPRNDISVYFLDRKKTMPTPEMAKWVDDLRQEILTVRPNIVLALGQTALWALTGQTSVTEARGYITESTLVPGTKVMPTWHPQNLNYEPSHFWMALMDFRKAARDAVSPGDNRIFPTTHTKLTLLQQLDYLHTLQSEAETVAVDIETSIHKSVAWISMIAFAPSAREAISVSFTQDAEQNLRLWQAIAPILVRKECIFQNGKFDTTVLESQYHMPCPGYQHDTMILGHVLYPEMPRSLRFFASIFLNVESWKSTSGEDQSRYNALDAAHTFGCFQVMWKQLQKDAASVDVYKHEMLQVWPAMDMEVRGIAIDNEKRLRMIQSARNEMQALDQELNQFFGRPVNLNSPKQLQKVFYEDLGLPAQYKRRKSKDDAKTVSIDAKALKRLQKLVPEQHQPIVDKVLRRKKLEKLVSSFLQIDLSPAGRVHTNYNVTGANMLHESGSRLADSEEAHRSFGRWSSSKSIVFPFGSGNFQNIPPEAREIYIPDPGNIILCADYVQAEAVVVAHISKDHTLIKMFQDSYGLSPKERKDRGYDLHRLTAAGMYQCRLEDVTPEQRSIGKRLRHAMNYSAGPTVIADSLECSMAEAKRAMKLFVDANPAVEAWHQDIVATLNATRTLRNLFGRPHRFYGMWGDSLFRSAYSYIPQSTVGELMNRALTNIYHRLHEVEGRLMFQLHDAVYVQIPPSRLHDAIALIRQEAAISLPSPVTGAFCIDVDFHAGKNWREMEDL